jgi:phage shock protein PspC (stress-responsive transcriptional regulator)
MDDMTQTHGPAAGPTNNEQASGIDRFFDWLRSIDLRRDGEDKWLAGVCSGIATRLGVDPIVIRAVLVLLVVMGGLGITVYLIAWAFLPNDKEDIVAERALRDGDVLGIILLIVIGLSLVGGTGFAGDVPGMGWIWWVVIPVGLVFWLVTRKRDSGPSFQPATAPAAMQGATQAPTWTTDTSTRSADADVEQAERSQPGTWASVATPTSAATSSTTTAPTAPYGAATPPGGGWPPAPPAARQPRPPRPPRAPKPPRRRSGGFGATLLVGGLAVAAYGLTSWAHQANHWAGSDQTVALCAALGVVGLGVLGLGLAGRRAGFTGFLAVVLALVTWTSSVVPDVTFGGGIGERVWRPSVTDTTESYRLSIGSADLDLSQLPDNPDTARHLEARVGMGELRIHIPKNLTVEVHSSVAAGDITRADFGSFDPLPPSLDSDPIVHDDTNDNGRNISTVQTFGTGDADVVIDAHVGLGQILIGKE